MGFRSVDFVGVFCAFLGGWGWILWDGGVGDALICFFSGDGRGRREIFGLGFVWLVEGCVV